MAKWGFFSDFLCGPFYAFGVTCPDKDMLKKANDKHLHTSGEISAYNVGLYIDELRERFQGGGAAFRIKFLPCEARVSLEKHKYKHVGRYDRIFCSSHFAHYLPNCTDLLLPEKGQVVVETARFAPKCHLHSQICVGSQAGPGTGIPRESIADGQGRRSEKVSRVAKRDLLQSIEVSLGMQANWVAREERGFADVSKVQVEHNNTFQANSTASMGWSSILESVNV